MTWETRLARLIDPSVAQNDGLFSRSNPVHFRASEHQPLTSAVLGCYCLAGRTGKHAISHSTIFVFGSGVHSFRNLKQLNGKKVGVRTGLASVKATSEKPARF